MYTWAKEQLEAGYPLSDVAHISEAVMKAVNRERELLDLRAREWDLKAGDTEVNAVAPTLKTWYKRVIREELAQTPEKPVRFATADTVAKVEGWPRDDYWLRQADRFRRDIQVLEESTRDRLQGNDPPFRQEIQRRELAQLESLRGELKAAEELQKQHGPARFSKEHQSIHDRYKGEIEKFLRNEFKAKPYTDEHGHTWLEVPPQPKGPVKMYGRASTADLAALAAFVGGAAAMQAFTSDPSLVSDVVAGLLASAATRISPRSLAEAYRSARDSRPLESISKAAIVREANMRRNALDTANTIFRVTKLVKDEARREAIHTALDTGNTRGLAPNELAAYNDLKEQYAKLAKAGVDEGVLEDTRRNYATHLWQIDADVFDRIFGKRVGRGTSPNTPTPRASLQHAGGGREGRPQAGVEGCRVCVQRVRELALRGD